MRRAAVVLLVVLLPACGGGLEVDDGGADGGVLAPLWLGSAAPDGGGFLPLTDGQDAPLIAGAQGGFHVWMKYRVRGMPPEEAKVLRMAWRDDDDTLVLRTNSTVQIGPPDDGGEWELPAAVPMFMCPSPIGVRVVDEVIRYEITIEDDSGTPQARGSVRMVPRCPDEPADLRDFCLRICTG